ncbi:MAG TPA: hypothetical protein VK447_12040 [Myxococcaceae bacterium]|nr:hypothetical protein [Myxococcaceae bacterium]
MEALGGYSELPSPTRELGFALFILLLCVTAVLEQLQFKLRATEGRNWWAGNGRDVLNAAALGMIALGLKLLGFAGPISFCIAATLVVLLTWVESAVGDRKHATVLSLAAALGLGAPILLFPHSVHAFFRGALEVLF